jgi:predicted pyridoxine 5'-phosphate oxidase superfamily flavin-nucleotide-binding protein
VFDEKTIAFADFRGNRQYVTTGNLATDPRVAIIMVDYPNQARLKILGTAQIMAGAGAEDVIERVRSPGYEAVIERAFVIRVEAFDWNCPQHITPRYTEAQIHDALKPTLTRIDELERENGELRQLVRTQRVPKGDA